MSKAHLSIHDLTPPPAVAPVPPPVSAPESSSFLGDRPREKRISLEWPKAFRGKSYAAITIKRLTVADVAAFIEKLDGGKLRFPIFFDDEGAPVPDALLDALDDDDGEVLDREALDFLPRRFRAPPEKAPGAGSAPSAGAATEHS